MSFDRTHLSPCLKSSPGPGLRATSAQESCKDRISTGPYDFARLTYPYTGRPTARGIGYFVRTRRKPITIAQYDWGVLLGPSSPRSIRARNKLSRFRPSITAVIAVHPECHPDGDRGVLLEEDVDGFRLGAVRDKEHRVPVNNILALSVAGDCPRLGPLAIGILGEPAILLVLCPTRWP